MEYEKNISSIEAKYYLKKENESWNIEKTKANQQSSYNLPSEFFQYAKEHGILVEDENFDYSRKETDGNAYVLNDEYKFILGKGVLWILGKDFKSEGNFFFGSMNPNKKFQIYRSSYNKKITKNEGKEFKWFIELYDRNLSGNKLILKINEEEKELELDVAIAIESDVEENNMNKEEIIEQNIVKLDEETKVKLDEETKGKLQWNRIIFGAPGTGKSYTLNEEKKVFEHQYERVTFHPNYSYGQFVGVYKPVSGEKTVDYKYVPGPFMRVLTKAMASNRRNDGGAYLLIIEEINRANVASVFGDVFQLLDRNSDGESEYEIETSEEMRKYLCDELGGDIAEYEKIKIPSNMYIWATMNSADQGVFPMDTAFKRRWDFEYLGVDDNQDGIKERKVKLGSDQHEVKWNDLRKAINYKLINECNANEDKLLGPYFLSKSILEVDEDNFVKDNEKFLKLFKNKVIMYLFEDAVGRQKRNTFFKGCPEATMYSKICLEFDKSGEGIFGLSLGPKPKVETSDSDNE